MLRDHMPVAARIRSHTADADDVRAVHQPHRGGAVVVLPNDVGLAVAVVIAGLQHMPGRAGIESDIRAREAETYYRLGRRREARRIWNSLLAEDGLDTDLLKNIAVN